MWCGEYLIGSRKVSKKIIFHPIKQHINNSCFGENPIDMVPNDNENKSKYRASENYFRLPYNPSLKKRAQQLRKAGNQAEVVLWNQLKKQQFKGFDFDRQKIIGNYIVDFFCTNCNVVIEVDGGSHAEKMDYDLHRDAYLTSKGLVVIHFSDADVLYNVDWVMQELENHPALVKKNL